MQRYLKMIIEGAMMALLVLALNQGLALFAFAADAGNPTKENVPEMKNQSVDELAQDDWQELDSETPAAKNEPQPKTAAAPKSNDEKKASKDAEDDLSDEDLWLEPDIELEDTPEGQATPVPEKIPQGAMPEQQKEEPQVAASPDQAAGEKTEDNQKAKADGENDEGNIENELDSSGLDEEWEEGWTAADEADLDKATGLNESAASSSEPIPSVLTNLEECKRVALINDRRIQVALKEIKYNRYKLLEAERQFLPQVKASWEKQKGSSASGSGGGGSDTGFSGLKYGIEAQQILFNGGKLTYQLKQAKTNLDVAKKKYLQARQELIYKVEKAYYGLVKAQMAFEIQADLSKSAESALSYSREAYRQGVNAYHEFLNVQSQTDQTYYQLLSSQQEVALAELDLRQACNVDTSIGIQINAVLTFTDFEFNYSLEECLELAFKNRPDLAVNELTTLSDIYGIKMSMAEGLPKIEFMGTVGKNGQSKETKALDLNDEWSAKVQATWILGANSLQYSLEKKKTVPTQFGATDNIKDSQTHDVTLSIFDKLENFSNLAKEVVTKTTSEADLVELRGKVAHEVEENYYKYQKAMTMVTASLSKIKFREKDLEVNRAKQMMNEVPLSQVLTIELQLGEDRVNYVQALSDYYTSISGLFKAMGLSK